MTAVADDEPPSIADLTGFQNEGRAWVVANDEDEPVAYLLLDIVDGNAHVEQVSVHPDHARQGLGRKLLETADLWAAQHGLPALTLTTYRDVPWNAPYYERLGFRVLTEVQMTAGLRSIRAHEAARGLARWPRVAMRRTTPKVAELKRELRSSAAENEDVRGSHETGCSDGQSSGALS